MKELISNQDRTVLRQLATQVAEIAALPVQRETIALTKALNGLKPVRPMVMIDQVCWHEMNVDGELTLQTDDAFCRDLETRLRRTLYSWKHMRADMVVEPVIDIAKVIRSTGFGIETVEERAILDPQNDVVGHFYIDQIKTEEDLQNLHAPEIELNVEATALAEEKAHAIFDGILGVRMQGFVPWFAPWDAITTWRGAQNVLWDMADRPEFMYRLISKLADASHAQLDQLEAKGLLGYAQSTIHCTGAYSDELPADGFDPQRPRATDLWTFGMAQIFSSVSPAMHLKYDIEFAIPWYERFGLGYYGCCEPLDEKIDIVRKIPHVRKVSMSPWVNQERGAEGLGHDLVFSRKPSPAFLATDGWEPEAVERDLRTTLETCRRHGCPVELILKDISTVRYQPQRLWEWSQIAARLVREG